MRPVEPLIQRSREDKVINLTECDTCNKAIHPQEALWGENDQPYCSSVCGQEQTYYYDTQFYTLEDE